MKSVTENKETFRISVRDLVEISHAKGDLSGGYSSRTRALDGIREHTRVQGSRPAHYKKEVPVSLRLTRELFILEIFGRIDGMFELEKSIRVEEIKTCRKDPERLALYPGARHLAQLKCYGYLVLTEKKLERIELQLTYVQVDSRKTAEKKKEYTRSELELFFNDLVSRYSAILENRVVWKRVRNLSIRNLPFPYEDFKESQRQLAESVYKVIKNKKILFARAPTGTGKTIATLFPAIKSLGLGQVEKIFFLTAKTVGRTVASKALDDMQKKGLRCKRIIITAKQKICFVSDDTCDMESCPYALNYYEKLANAMEEVVVHDVFDQERIESMAEKYEICPFELSLDISLECDVIICDLNYCFDPRVYLKRFFDRRNTNYTFLVDEAHNLPDRLRSMYSAKIFKNEVLKTQRLVRKQLPEISKSLIAMNKIMLGLKKQCIADETEYLEFDGIPEDFLTEIRKFARKADKWLDKNIESEFRTGLLEFYFSVNIFLTIHGFFDTNYKFFIERIGENDLCIRLFCMDPSPIFSDLITRAKSSVLFSATLFPIDYYRTILFTDDVEPFSIVMPSSFPEDNFGLFLHSGIKTTYRERDRFFKEIADTIREIVTLRTGNYIIYFPSYVFMNATLDILDPSDDFPNRIVQTPNMTETQRQEFLDHFKPDHPIIGFAVMGGIFGEGIDLSGRSLIGAVIVGVGLPQICPEQDLIRAYYDDSDGSGFFTAYQMPGFNRVMQAAGRVIRTHEDKGVVVLMDQRFSRRDYTSLFPLEWTSCATVGTTGELKKKLATFWNRHYKNPE